MTPATSPSVIRLTAAPALRTAAIMSAWRGRSSISAVMSDGFTPLALARREDVLVGRRIEIDHALRIARADARSCPCRRRARSAACRRRPWRASRSRPACSWRTASCLPADRPRCRPCGPVLLPTFSPMNSIGASSRSPSPITTVPSIGSLLSSRRMASTAAWSAAFSSPRPRSRAADTAARSVTRTISSDRMRSSSWLGWTVIDGAFRAPLAFSGLLSIFLDADQLRLARNHPVALDRGERLAHRVFGGRVGDQNNRDRSAALLRTPPAGGPRWRCTIDSIEMLLLRKPLGDGRRGARLVHARAGGCSSRPRGAASAPSC